MAKIVVLGAGGWGTALGVMAHRAGNDVTLWSPFEQEIEEIREHSEHRKLLPGVAVDQSIDLTTDNAAMIAVCGYFKYLKKDFSTIYAAPYSAVKR